MKNEFLNKMEKLSNKINEVFNEKQIEKFFNYMNLLLEWNEKINLTAIVEEDDIILKHFIDSITINKYLKNDNKIIDVGTGAGFPGIPISIINEEKQITLLDSLNKRVIFLQDVIDKINLKNVNAIHSRAEDFGKNKDYREKYDVAVSRAVASLNILLEYMLPLVKVGGKCICMKGSNIEEELENSKFAIKELGGRLIKKEEFLLPDSDIKRNIIIIEKIKNTPSKYPRKSGTPVKQPL